MRKRKILLSVSSGNSGIIIGFGMMYLGYLVSYFVIDFDQSNMIPMNITRYHTFGGGMG